VGGGNLAAWPFRWYLNWKRGQKIDVKKKPWIVESDVAWPAMNIYSRSRLNVFYLDALVFEVRVRFSY
jgi:hypothetical protein